VINSELSVVIFSAIHAVMPITKNMLIKISHYSLKIEPISFLPYLCVFSLLMSLGFWQLDRSNQKREFLNLEEQARAAEVLTFFTALPDHADKLRFKTVVVEGRYDSNHQFLLDNQIIEGKVGYFVLTPFLLKGQEKAILVNRGWVPLGADRSILPTISLDQGLVNIKGRINNFPSVGIKLAGAERPSDSWPSIVQVVNSDIVGKKLGYSLLDFQLELNKDMPDGFKREWHAPVVMLPEQHVAYAVQWFLLALTLTIIFIWYSLKSAK